MKRIAILSMIIVLLLTTACSAKSQKEQASNVTELTMWSMETRSRETIEKSIEQFNKDHADIKLTAEFFEDEALKTKMKVAIAGNQLPDIITYWSGETFDTLVASGMLGDITASLNEDAELRDNVLPGGLETFTYDEKSYAVPVLFSGVSLWYNKAIFNENGLTPPTSYDELVQVVDQLNAKQITPIAIAGKERWPMLHWFSYLAQRIGGTEPFEKAKNGEADFTQDSFVQAGEMLRELAIDKKAFVNGFLGLDYASAESLFINGKAAMYLQGEWAMDAFLNDEFADTVGFTTFPAVEGGQGSVHVYQGGFGVGMAISSKTNQEAAYAAISFLSSPEQRKEIYEGANISPMKNPGLDEANMHPLAYEYDKAISENLEGFFGYYDQALDARRADQFLDLMGAIVGQSDTDVKSELAKIK